MNQPPAVTVRPASPSDLPVVVEFNHALARESEGKSLDRKTLTSGVRTALEDANRCLYFMAECAGRVVGQTMITFEWSDWHDAYFWWIQSVYVDPAYRRRGVFRALHEHIRTIARARADVCGFRLYAHRDNHRALETYRRLGMAPPPYVLREEDWSAESSGDH